MPAVTVTSLLLLVGAPFLFAQPYGPAASTVALAVPGATCPRVAAEVLVATLVIPFVMGLPVRGGALWTARTRGPRE
jgi:hypothetical protein